jgi:hypothetical protein
MKILIVVQCFIVSLLSEQTFNVFGEGEPEYIDSTFGAFRKRESESIFDLIFRNWNHIL